MFLEYNNICSRIKKFLEWKDVPLRFEELPRNSTMNMLVKLNTKGCSRLYSKIKDSNSHVLDTLVEKWSVDSDIDTDSISMSRSFHKHHTKYKDTYLKYLQFRTLHHRFFTNDKLFTMGITQSNLCSMCKTETDSIERMLLECQYSRTLWDNISIGIRELGIVDYNLTSTRIIIGDLDNALAINSIILHTKKVIMRRKKNKSQTF